MTTLISILHNYNIASSSFDDSFLVHNYNIASSSFDDSFLVHPTICTPFDESISVYPTIGSLLDGSFSVYTAIGSPDLLIFIFACFALGLVIVTIFKMPMPGVRCPSCEKRGVEQWVLPGKNCPICAHPC